MFNLEWGSLGKHREQTELPAPHVCQSLAGVCVCVGEDPRGEEAAHSWLLQGIPLSGVFCFSLKVSRCPRRILGNNLSVDLCSLVKGS